jgi:hypothetical protein
MIVKFVLFSALAIATVAAVAVFAAGGENGTDSKYASDRSLPFARRPEPFGTGKHPLP